MSMEGEIKMLIGSGANNLRSEILRRVLLLPVAMLVFSLNNHSTVAAQEKQEKSDEDVVMPKLGDRLTDEQVASFANLALKNIQTE